MGYSGWKDSKNLGELTSCDYPTFGAFIWYRELTGLSLLLLTGYETILFGVRSLGISIHCITPNYHPCGCVKPPIPGRL